MKTPNRFFMLVFCKRAAADRKNGIQGTSSRDAPGHEGVFRAVSRATIPDTGPARESLK